MWYEKVYAAMSNLAGESGILVSGLLCCVLSFEKTVSLHLLRELLTISTVDMVLSHSAQYIMGPRGATITCHNCSVPRGEFFWSDVS